MSSDLILLVDDSEISRAIIRRRLEDVGFRVNEACDGAQGAVAALREVPAVVITDLEMPIMDGYKAIAQIKADPRTRHLPVFVVSAWSSKKERVQAHTAGADEFFVKPPDLDKLTEAINNAVGGRK